jgi:hypothetical protein
MPLAADVAPFNANHSISLTRRAYGVILPTTGETKMNERQLKFRLIQRDLDEDEIEEILDDRADFLLLDEAHQTLMDEYKDEK